MLKHIFLPDPFSFVQLTVLFRSYHSEAHSGRIQHKVAELLGQEREDREQRDITNLHRAGESRTDVFR